MSSVPAPADPGWGEDPAWLDRDPMSPEEREAWLDRLCAQDDDPSDQPEEYLGSRVVRAAAGAGRADQLPDGTFRWTTPSGRSYDTEPTRYPI